MDIQDTIINEEKEVSESLNLTDTDLGEIKES